MKTFNTLKKGDKIIMEHVQYPVQCCETVNGTTYLSKIKEEDLEVTVLSDVKTVELTDEDIKYGFRGMLLYVTTFGEIFIPYQYMNSNVCPNSKNRSTLKIVNYEE